MRKFSLVLLAMLGWVAGVAGAEVLIVADEMPAMQVLAARLQASNQQITSRIVTQGQMPSKLSPFSAVVVYIHRNLSPLAEKAFINYAEAGGKLVLLHHSISSAKKANRNWFPFLGVRLPEGDVEHGGYKWIEGVTLEIVNLAPQHFITTNAVSYADSIPYRLEGGPLANLPRFTLQQTEVYLNHVLTGPRTTLLGLKYTDASSGKTYMQATAGWVKATGKGVVIYLMAGHSALDFENAAYGQIVVNAITWDGAPATRPSGQLGTLPP